MHDNRLPGCADQTNQDGLVGTLGGEIATDGIPLAGLLIAIIAADRDNIALGIESIKVAVVLVVVNLIHDAEVVFGVGAGLEGLAEVDVGVVAGTVVHQLGGKHVRVLVAWRIDRRGGLRASVGDLPGTQGAAAEVTSFESFCQSAHWGLDERVAI